MFLLYTSKIILKGREGERREKRRLILKRKRWQRMNGRKHKGRKRRKGREGVIFRTVVLKG